MRVTTVDKDGIYVAKANGSPLVGSHHIKWPLVAGALEWPPGERAIPADCRRYTHEGFHGFVGSMNVDLDDDTPCVMVLLPPRSVDDAGPTKRKSMTGPMRDRLKKRRTRA